MFSSGSGRIIQLVIIRNWYSLMLCPQEQHRRNQQGSGGECEATSGAANNQLLRHLLLRQVNKILPAAVHWHYVFDIELIQFGHDLTQIVIRGGREMKATDEGVDLLDTTDLLGAFQGVDDPGMSA